MIEIFDNVNYSQDAIIRVFDSVHCKYDGEMRYCGLWV
jgi:hypothetical protein